VKNKKVKRRKNTNTWSSVFLRQKGKGRREEFASAKGVGRGRKERGFFFGGRGN